MHPVSHSSIHVSLLWTAARNAVRGQPGSPILSMPIHDTILAQRGLETSALCRCLCHSIPCLLKMKIFFLPCPQQGSNSLKKGAARLCWIKQTNKRRLAHSACMQGSLKMLRRGERMKIFSFFFILQNAFFFKNLLITSVNQVSAYSPWLLELTQT